MNDSGEILLPGQAFLLHEGVLVGATLIEAVVPGENLTGESWLEGKDLQ